ncbi:hypothetical protein CXR25_06275 [Brevibacterium aurantiacum]|uniref:DUF3017 domain-containing protein n=1 Tax=Brevibacterium aurantiacum TaxID=273384 RepID=A0A368M5V5_BREAU|nr:hypothetical protein CXR26_06105 [Brevibacterium aurantiacum]AZL12457.1 hypothetical protein CXR25_06275 [Brevibacterium aurantiacum]AZT92904.1 hypothetical protein CXR23_06915 [Brevibacterium aurantiacum]AZT96724.1 hypothetical protein CXR27_06670 [Brevibacterium aurantiacum]RCS86287.1 hypothetical protein CIK63_14460 [Brevibacterium aurantiacum]
MSSTEKVKAHPRHARRGRGPIAKRWIYWKRRYANPVLRDWVLLGCLLGILIAAACTLIDFHLGAIVLAVVPAGLAMMRAMPEPWAEVWTNRSKTVDIATGLIFAVVLVALAFVVPESR